MTFRCLSLLGLLFVNANFALAAETFTTLLDLQVETNASGEYLSASYDFGIRFSEVESVRIEFIMPEGYESSHATTGNSSYSRTLHINVDDGSNAIDNPLMLRFPTALSVSPYSIQASELVEYSLGQRRFRFDGTELEVQWPDFVHTGRGRVSVVDAWRSDFHPLSGEVPPSSTTTFQVPGAVEFARITIVATPVPEPNCVFFVVVGAFLAWMRFRRIG